MVTPPERLARFSTDESLVKRLNTQTILTFRPEWYFQILRSIPFLYRLRDFIHIISLHDRFTSLLRRLKRLARFSTHESLAKCLKALWEESGGGKLCRKVLEGRRSAAAAAAAAAGLSLIHI